MRLSPPVTILTIVAVALASISIARWLRLNDRREESCSAALAYLQYVDARKQKPLLIHDEGWGGPTQEDISRAIRGDPDVRKHPDFEIYEHAANIQEVSPVLDCPGVLSWLRSKKIAHHDRHVIDKLLRPFQGLDGETYPWDVIGMSMPAISNDRGRSIFDSSIYGALLGGAIYRVEMAQDHDGRWFVVRTSVMAVS
ncbi:MAG TPA: hypothetical protein VHG29_11210 [Novosphingobium sp.]|nr:hypothetical protein [Novosphingobium sp.]